MSVVLGFVGQMVSGKGTSAAYLEEKHKAHTYRFSTMLRDALDRFYLEHTRDHLVKISEIIRETFGEDTMARTMAKDVANDTQPLIVVEGIRREADIVFLKALPNFVLVRIHAEPKTRYERLIARTENVDDQTKTFEQFLEDHKRSTEVSIAPLEAQAAEEIDNNASFEALHKQLDALVLKYAA